MGKNYSNISGTSAKEFNFTNNKVSQITGRQTVINNQATPLAITDFLVDKTKYSAFEAIVSINRNVTASGMAGVQNNGNAKQVKQVLRTGTNLVVVGDFTEGVYALNLLDGTINSTFASNIGTGFNDTVNGVFNTGSGLLFFGKFTSFNGATRNRVCFTDYDGVDQFGPYDTFGLNAGSGATGFNGEVTCGSNDDPSYWFFAGNDIELNGNSNLNGVWQVDKSATSVAVAYSSAYVYGVPVFLMWNAPYGGGLFIGGVSNLDSTNPERHIVNLGSVLDACSFDAPVLCGAVEAGNNFYWFGGEFDNVNGSSCPKLVLTNIAAPSSVTPLVKDAGYTSAFAATSGNKVSYIFSALDAGSAYGVAIVCGKFNDFTSQNLVSIDADGTEYTTYSSGYGAGVPAAINSFTTGSGMPSALSGEIFGGDTIPATDTFTYMIVASIRKSQLRRINGNFDSGSGNISIANNTGDGDAFGVVISFDASTGQFKYTSTFLPTNISEIRFKLDLL